MASIKRMVELHAGQDSVLMPEGLFRIDRRERPRTNGWYDVEYDPFDQFIVVIGLAGEVCRTPTCPNGSTTPRRP